MQCCSISFTQQHQGHLRWIKSAYFNTYFMCNLIFTQWVCANTDNTPSTFNLAVWRPRVKRNLPFGLGAAAVVMDSRSNTQTQKHTLQPGLDPPARARLSMPMQVQTVPGRGGFHRWLLKNVTFPVSTALVVCADTQKARLLLKHTLATGSPTHLSESVLSSNSFQAFSSCQGPHDNVKTSRCGDIYYMLKIVQYSHL